MPSFVIWALTPWNAASNFCVSLNDLWTCSTPTPPSRSVLTLPLTGPQTEYWMFSDSCKASISGEPKAMSQSLYETPRPCAPKPAGRCVDGVDGVGRTPRAR